MRDYLLACCPFLLVISSIGLWFVIYISNTLSHPLTISALSPSLSLYARSRSLFRAHCVIYHYRSLYRAVTPHPISLFLRSITPSTTTSHSISSLSTFPHPLTPSALYHNRSVTSHPFSLFLRSITPSPTTSHSASRSLSTLPHPVTPSALSHYRFLYRALSLNLLTLNLSLSHRSYTQASSITHSLSITRTFSALSFLLSLRSTTLSLSLSRRLLPP